MTADEALAWVRTELCGLCEATEDDSFLKRALKDWDDAPRDYARGCMHTAESIRRTMSDLIQSRREMLVRGA